MTAFFLLFFLSKILFFFFFLFVRLIFKISPAYFFFIQFFFLVCSFISDKTARSAGTFKKSESSQLLIATVIFASLEK